MPAVELNGRTAPGLACPPGTKEIVYWSDELPGFGLRCRDSGVRTWCVQYRTKVGEMRKHTLGNPQTVPFAKAHKEAARLLAAVKLGNDPGAEAKRARGAIQIADLVTSYLAHQKPRMKPRSYVELDRHVQKHLKPLHARKAGSVSQRDVVELLQGLAKPAPAAAPAARPHAVSTAPDAKAAPAKAKRQRPAGGPVTANRVRASLSAMFAWGMKAGLVSANPVAATFKPTEERPRERVLTDGDLALIWRCTGTEADYDRIVRLLLLTGSRREEIAGIADSEVARHQDGTATWILPSERSKNHLPHELVLPRMAADLLPALRQNDEGQPRALLFGEGDGPFSGWSRCKERLDGRIAKANGGKAIPPWVLHDLRRTFVTRLNDMGVEPHVIEALVNHASGSAKAGVAGVYNRSTYATPKRAALVLWCDHVAKLVKPAPANQGAAAAANVVPLRLAG